MQPRLLIYILFMAAWLRWQTQIVTETTWPAEPKIFTIWLLKRVHQLLAPEMRCRVRGDWILNHRALTGWGSSGPGGDG